MSEDIQPLRKNSKRALGRGLGSLLGEISAPSPEPIKNETADSGLPRGAPPQSPTSNENRVWKVAIEKVIPNKSQPRRHFDQGKLLELAQSIKENGIILPVVARAVANGQFEIIAGERRWRAAQMAGLQEIPVILRAVENKESLELALVENIQRHDLNPLEEAEAYSVLAEKYALTQQQIAEKVGKDRATVANLLRLTHLSTEVKSLVKSGELQQGQAKVLLGITDPKMQIRLAKKAAQLKLSVRAVEKMVAKELIRVAPTKSLAEVTALDQVKQELQRILGTKVAIQSAGKKTTVSVSFYSAPELNQFLEKLRKLSK
jgi:ParB family chromosome partitioning protein